MTEESRVFLKKNLPEALEENTLKSALRLLFDWINRNGFAPPDYYDYNDLGREAQRVYDDLFLSNAENPERNLFPLNAK